MDPLVQALMERYQMSAELATRVAATLRETGPKAPYPAATPLTNNLLDHPQAMGSAAGPFTRGLDLGADTVKRVDSPEAMRVTFYETTMQKLAAGQPVQPEALEYVNKVNAQRMPQKPVPAPQPRVATAPAEATRLQNNVLDNPTALGQASGSFVRGMDQGVNPAKYDDLRGAAPLTLATVRKLRPELTLQQATELLMQLRREPGLTGGAF